MARYAVAWIGRVAQALLLAAFTSCATVAPAPATGKPFVWRVTNLPVPFYLVGSMHNLSPRHYPLPPAYQVALTNSRRLVFEHDPRQGALLSRKYREAARYPAGQTIESEIAPATLSLLRKNAWRSRLTFEQMRRFRPWAVALHLLAAKGPVGADHARSMDSHLSAQARRSGKEVAGLETTDEHIAFWREMLEPDGENLLRYTLTRGQTVAVLFDKTRDIWQRGDVEALTAANARLRRTNPGFARRLLDRRNLRWIDRIEAEMKTGKPTSIVAGAGHFTGERGVIALLQKRGYKIERL